ncbi:cytochrome-c peroxidase [Maliponia aquimaris]|uniref:Cytochrome c551 peroxidase n=1 Tax=Maliponia aquimaris TaxID=1673631 RepID=A0A238K843_9RHOB|nr:cytochrome c peroxidase [Maliponia aquimaris]SMX39060.1 Cytochrome c551 peroxidase precursor [Maliponia aquimaris]
MLTRFPLLRTVLRLAALTLTALPAAAQQESLSPQGFLNFDKRQAQLGQLLFYDKILSGNRNISCGTCHHHSLSGADALSLGIGEGGQGLGLDRTPGEGATRIAARIPRNAPALWNLGHGDVRVLFHDGRVEKTDAKGMAFETPAKGKTPAGLNSVLAAQALFPVSSPAEMAGAPDENPVSAAFAESIDLGWAMLADRVRAIPEYERLFVRAFPNVRSGADITIVEIANAIAAFEASEWQSHDSPYDTWLSRGTPLSPEAERGRQLFFGAAGCAGCHSGPLFTDQEFHAVGIPQFGPGRPFDGDTLPRDLGRMETTRNPSDAYKFRTPSLRNVALTAPYGHNGAYPDLRSMIRHMCDPITARAEWTPGMARLPDVAWLKDTDFRLMSYSDAAQAELDHLDITPVEMVDGDIDALEAFLNALTGETALTRPLGHPDRVPSGLPVD